MKGRLIVHSGEVDTILEKGMHERLDAQDKVLETLVQKLDDLKVKRVSDPTLKEKIKSWFGR